MSFETIFNLYEEILLEQLMELQLEQVLEHSFNHDEELKRKNKINVLLEKYKYTSDEKRMCEICFDRVKRGQYTCDLTCNHKFHFKCLHEWLHYKQNCPVCRSNI